MFHYDLLDETQNKLDYILPLSLTVENFLECRLHILVFKSGMAKFIHQCILDKRVQGSKTSNDSAQSSSAMLAVEKDDRHAIADKRVHESWYCYLLPCFSPLVTGRQCNMLHPKQYRICCLESPNHPWNRKKDLDDFVEAALMFYGKRNLLDNTPITLNLEKDNDPRLSASPLKFPGKLAIDILNNRLFIFDSNHNRIVVTDLDGNFIVQIGSSWEQGLQDGSFDDATFNKLVTVLEI
ncbi:hypothetical protein HN51_023226 [Arachis hypogaea]